MVFWFLNEKENKEAGANCFDVRIPRIYYGLVPSKMDRRYIKRLALVWLNNLKTSNKILARNCKLYEIFSVKMMIAKGLLN